MFGRWKKQKDEAQPPAAVDTGAPLRMSLRSHKEMIQPTPPPPPPPRRRREHGRIVTIGSAVFSFLLFATLIAGVLAYWGAGRVMAPGPLTAERTLVVQGAAPDIAQDLQRAGVIDQPFLFELAVRLRGVAGKLKRGEYLFRPGISISEVIDVLVEGKSILHAVTIPEGLTSQQIVERLATMEFLSGDVRDVPPEGSLLPETYKVMRGTSRAEVVRRMQNEQREQLDRIWRRRAGDLPLASPQELVILASIVEKETGRADERTRVAGVFVNRLRRNMKLQSDPTIIYGLVGGRGALGRGILRSEIERPTPYNTYVINGLPPGPIGNPGRASMEAVANPSRTKDLYFVADGTGGHAFAETLDQHNRNVARWRQIEAQRKADEEKAAAERAASQEEAPAAAPAAPATEERRSDAGEEPTLNPNAPATVGSTGPGTFPVPASRRERLSRDAAAIGGQPTAPDAPAPLQALGSGTAREPQALGTAGARPRGFDAVAGTPKDPLLDKTFDLNSPKVVPRLRQTQ